jgi:hypothetical protein
MNNSAINIKQDPEICLKPVLRKASRISGLGIAIFLILANPFFSCKNINRPFYDKVLNDFDTTSYFIAVDVKSPSYKGRTIIENNNLYLFLQKTKGFSKEKYKSFMIRILAHHRALKIEDKDLYTWKFKKVKYLESVIKIADHGMNDFVAFYFNGKVLNYGVTPDEQNAVINQLFYWDYPLKIDKLTGDLIIE